MAPGGGNTKRHTKKLFVGVEDGSPVVLVLPDDMNMKSSEALASFVREHPAAHGRFAEMLIDVDLDDENKVLAYHFVESSKV